jgi:DNA-binding XRE family transcriptional regulator
MKVRARRLRVGMTQAQLAAATGLSRQLVGAVETGRHAPSVYAAMALATALGATVEELFAPAETERTCGVTETPAEGAPVVATTVGDRLCVAPVADRGAGTGSWIPADGVYHDGGVALFPDARPTGAAVAGCDPALGLAAALLPRRGPRRLVAIEASSGRAAEALRSGRLHAALVHGPSSATGRIEGTVRWTMAAWEVGLAARPGTHIDLEQIAEGRQRVAQREPSASAQQALERALEPLGPQLRPVGPLASGHLDAARQVVHGAAEAAVTMRAAALAYELAFLPLERHVVELVVDERWVGHPGVAALGELLGARSFRARLASLGGYDLSQAGTRRD